MFYQCFVDFIIYTFTYFAIFILKYFMVYLIWSYNIFKFLFSNRSLLEYRNVVGFCILTSYTATLLKSLVSSNNLFVDTLGFSIYTIMSSANLYAFYFLFLAWLHWLGIPVWCWVEVVRMYSLALFLILGEKYLVFDWGDWLLTGNYKGFAWQPSQVKCPAQLRLTALQCLKGITVKDSDPCGWLHSYTYFHS